MRNISNFGISSSDLRALKMLVTNLSDTGEDSKLVRRRNRPKVDTLFSSLFFRPVRATSMTQCRVENTRVHFDANSLVSVNSKNFKSATFEEKRCCVKLIIFHVLD